MVIPGVRRHLSKESLVATLIAGLVACVGLVVFTGLVGQTETGLVSEPWIWLVCIAGFVVADATVVRLHIRSEVTAFTFLEVPLFLAAIFVAPGVVWGSMTIGVAISVLIQRLPLMKAVFNIANLSLQGAVGLWLFHEFLAAASPLGPRGWVSAVAAGVLSNALSAVALFVVLMIVVEGRQQPAAVGQVLFINAITALTNVSLALLAASLIDYQPGALVLLVFPTAVLYGAYRAYTAEQHQRERLNAVHDLALEVRSIRNEAGLIPMLQRAAEHMGAVTAELILFPTDRGNGRSATRYRVSGELHEYSEVVPSDLAKAIDRVHLVKTPTLISSGLLTQSEMAGAIRGEERPMGLLVLRGRHRDTEFTDSDLAMFTTMVEQLGLTLEKNQLDRALVQLEQREAELEHVASHDALTGLANRTLLASRLDDMVSRSIFPTVLYVDLDDFKAVNDALGHQAGDEVLIEVGRRFTAAIGSDDLAVRLGGDEFALLLVGPHDDVAMAEMLIDAIRAPIQTVDGVAIVNASIGVARSSPLVNGLDQLLRRADAAMYRAKEVGKGTVVVDAR